MKNEKISLTKIKARLIHKKILDSDWLSRVSLLLYFKHTPVILTSLTVCQMNNFNCLKVMENKRIRTQTYNPSLHVVTQCTFGILAPSSWYCLGFFRKLTNSKISSMASSQPATSFSLMLMLSLIIFALDSVILSILLPLPCCHPADFHCLDLNFSKPSSATNGSKITRKFLDKKRC